MLNTLVSVSFTEALISMLPVCVVPLAGDSIDTFGGVLSMVMDTFAVMVVFVPCVVTFTLKL